MKRYMAMVTFMMAVMGGTVRSAESDPAELPPIPIRFKLDKPGVVTLVVDDATGKRVRNLISETPFEAGEHVVSWDGKDDLKAVQPGGEAIYRIEGEPVAAGSYTARGLVHDPVHLRYEMPLNTAGNPPWPTVEGNGAWMGDTLPPMSVLHLPGEKPMMLLGTGVTESYGIIWTDLTGQRLSGIRSAGGGGGWWGAYLLARDNGPQADPNERVFFGGSWKNQMQIFALKIQPPFPDPSRGVRGMTVWHDMSHGRLIAQLDDTQAHPDFFADPSKSLLGGLAVHNRVIVAALTALNKLQVRNAGDGAVTAELPLESPRGVRVTADGQLLVLSGKRLVRFASYPPTGEPTVLVAKGLEDPRQIALDAEGNIFVSDRGLHQVKVFAPDGKPLRTIGEPGGPQLGPYNPRRMANPEGIEVAPDGRLWVAENYLYPRRLSIWNLDGTFVKGLYGNGWYGGGGALDPRDKARAYVHGNGGGMEFKLDWEKGASELKSIYYLAGKTGGTLPDAPQYPVYIQQRQYLANAMCYQAEAGEQVISIWQMRDGLAVPVAAVGQAMSWELLKDELFSSRWPAGVNLKGEYWHNVCLFAWSDLNDDGQVQPEEVQFQKGYGGPLTLGEDLTVTMANAAAYRPQRYTKAGAPVYELTNAATLFPGGRASFTSGGSQVFEGGDGWVVYAWTPEPMPKGGYVTGFKDGKLRWHYPVDSIGNHAGYSSPVRSRPGQMLAMTHRAGGLLRPKGTKETLWSMVGTEGNLYLLTSDGLFVATLFEDFRRAESGPAKGERGTLLDKTTLGQDAFYAAIHQSEDGIYAVAGHDATFVVRVDGLESIRRLPEQKVTVTGEALEAVKRLGAISPKTHPKMPVEKTADGRAQFHYSADIRAAKGAVDSISSGTFQSYPPAQAHINGISGGDTVYKFFMPAAVEAIEASAAYGNHAGPSYTYGIRYSLDGKTWKPIVEETGNQGEFTIKGKVDLPQGEKLVWVSFAGIGNGLVTLKGVDVKLTYKP